MLVVHTANLSSERYLTWFSQAVMRVLTFNYLMTLDRPNGDSQADERGNKFVDRLRCSRANSASLQKDHKRIHSPSLKDKFIHS